MALNAKQKLFVAAYLIERNSTQAVLAAGFTKNVLSARVIGTRLLADVSVQEAIDKGIQRQADRLEVTADKVVKEIASIAFDPHAKKFEKLKACELLGRHFKLFTDVQEHSGPNGGPVVVLRMSSNGSEAKPKEQPKKGKK